MVRIVRQGKEIAWYWYLWGETQMRKVCLHERPVTNSLAYLLCQEAKRADYRAGMTPEDVRAVSNRMGDIRDIGTIPIAHTTALPHERPVTNSLAYLLCQQAKRPTDYRPGMTPEYVRAVSKKSVRQHETTRAQVVRHRTRVSGLRDINDTNSEMQASTTDVLTFGCGQAGAFILAGIVGWTTGSNRPAIG